MTQPIKVDIWSDVQCPWCYIGKRKFEAAVAGFDGEVEVEYHSFELAPDTPVDYDGTPSDYLAAKFNIGPEQVQAMHDRVSGIAEAVGLNYDFEHMHQTNTVKAHELLHYAKAHGKQLELKERLLQALLPQWRARGAHRGPGRHRGIHRTRSRGCRARPRE